MPQSAGIKLLNIKITISSKSDTYFYTSYISSFWANLFSYQMRQVTSLFLINKILYQQLYHKNFWINFPIFNFLNEKNLPI